MWDPRPNQFIQNSVTETFRQTLHIWALHLICRQTLHIQTQYHTTQSKPTHHTITQPACRQFLHQHCYKYLLHAVRTAVQIPALKMPSPLAACTHLLQFVAAVLLFLPTVWPLPMPAVDSPFLAIKIDRDQGGVKYGFNSAVSKQSQNLVVSGRKQEKCE